MSEAAYQFSQGVFRIMESIFEWAFSVLRSGRLDFFIRNWLWVALIVSAIAIAIDQLLNFLINGRESTFLNTIDVIRGWAIRAYHWARKKLDSDYIPPVPLAPSEPAQAEGVREYIPVHRPPMEPPYEAYEAAEAASAEPSTAERSTPRLSWQNASATATQDTAEYKPIAPHAYEDSTKEPEARRVSRAELRENERTAQIHSNQLEKAQVTLEPLSSAPVPEPAAMAEPEGATRRHAPIAQAPSEPHTIEPNTTEQRGKGHV